MSKELKEKENTEIAEAQFFGTDGYTGYENVDSESLSVPFLRVAQANTAQINEDEPSYIDGLKLGHFYNTAAGKGYGRELRMVLLGYMRTFVVWGAEMGDFHGVLTAEEFKKIEPTLTRKGAMFIGPDGNRYQDTRNFFVVLPDHPEDGVILYPLKSAGITQSRKLLTRASAVRKDGKQVPLFASIWKVGTVKNQNDQGTWYEIGDKKSLVADWEGFVPKELQGTVLAAVSMVDGFMKQAVNINYGAAGDDHVVDEEVSF